MLLDFLVHTLTLYHKQRQKNNMIFKSALNACVHRPFKWCNKNQNAVAAALKCVGVCLAHVLHYYTIIVPAYTKKKCAFVPSFQTATGSTQTIRQTDRQADKKIGIQIFATKSI